MLTSVIVYIYTVVAFNFFRKFYVKEDDGNVDYKCHDMLTVSICRNVDYKYHDMLTVSICRNVDYKCHDMLTVSVDLVNAYSSF
jgi:hypothetical protein